MLVTFLGRKKLPFKKFFKGKPIVIISDGKIDYRQLKVSKLDFYDLLAMCREQGYFDIKDIAFAIFETSGKISVMPKANQKPLVATDIKLKPPKPKLVKYIIVDGEIIKENLKEISKNKNWVFKKLKVTKKRQLKNILFAIFDEKTNKINVEYKKQILSKN